MNSPPPRCAADANVILRYLLRDHEQLAEKARGLFEAVEDGRVVMVLNPVTLAEVVFVMASVYKVPSVQISDGLVSLLQADGVVMSEKEQYIRALQLFAGPVRHFGDACVCAAALEECEGRLFSFDRELSTVEGIERAETFPPTDKSAKDS